MEREIASDGGGLVRKVGKQAARDSDPIGAHLVPARGQARFSRGGLPPRGFTRDM